jgi:hypothetical protein
LCRDIDGQIASALCGIQVDPELITTIRNAYTDDLAMKLGAGRP